MKVAGESQARLFAFEGAVHEVPDGLLGGFGTVQDGVHVLDDRQIRLELLAQRHGGVAGVDSFGHHVGGRQDVLELAPFC